MVDQFTNISPKITTVQPGKVKRYACVNILWVVFGIGLMLVLNLKFKSIQWWLCWWRRCPSGCWRAGFDVAAAHHESGLRQHAGGMAIIVVFGAVIGKLMVDSGALTR